MSTKAAPLLTEKHLIFCEENNVTFSLMYTKASEHVLHASYNDADGKPHVAYCGLENATDSEPELLHYSWPDAVARIVDSMICERQAEQQRPKSLTPDLLEQIAKHNVQLTCETDTHGDMYATATARHKSAGRTIGHTVAMNVSKRNPTPRTFEQAAAAAAYMLMMDSSFSQKG